MEPGNQTNLQAHVSFALEDMPGHLPVQRDFHLSQGQSQLFIQYGTGFIRLTEEPGPDLESHVYNVARFGLGGENDLTQHASTEMQKRAMLAKGGSNIGANFVASTAENDKIKAKEAAYMHHTVKHNWVEQKHASSCRSPPPELTISDVILQVSWGDLSCGTGEDI